MSTTLTKGFKKPQTGDSGATFFPDLEFDIQQTNDHTHNGVDSQKLGPLASEAYIDVSAGTAWALVGDTYRKTITIPGVFSVAGYTLSKLNYTLRHGTTGEVLNLGNEAVTATSFYVYSIDNSFSINVVYTT